jgi:hypothetical protein
VRIITISIEKWPFGRPRNEWENNIKMGIKEMWYVRSLGQDSNNLRQGPLQSRQPIVWSSWPRILFYDRSIVFPKWVLHIMWYSAFSVSFRYLVVFLRPSNNCLLLLYRRPVTCLFSSIKCFRKQFLRKLCSTQLPFLRFITVGGPVCVSKQFAVFKFGIDIISTSGVWWGV